MTCQRSAGKLKGLLMIFEGWPNLRVKVIVARKTKTPELIGSLPDRDTDTSDFSRRLPTNRHEMIF